MIPISVAEAVALDIQLARGILPGKVEKVLISLAISHPHEIEFARQLRNVMPSEIVVRFHPSRPKENQRLREQIGGLSNDLLVIDNIIMRCEVIPADVDDELKTCVEYCCRLFDDMYVAGGELPDDDDLHLYKLEIEIIKKFTRNTRD